VAGRISGPDSKSALWWSAGAALALTLTLVGANAYIFFQTESHIHASLETLPPRDVAIVPGARVYPGGTPSAILEDRLRCAAALFKIGKVDWIIVSGDHKAATYDEPGAMRRYLIRRGVPSSRIYMDHAGLRTFDTMARAARVFKVENAVVCTQEFHLGRSVYLARHHGIDAVGLVADRRRYSSHRSNLAREFAARVVSLLDAHILHTEPRHTGPTIPLRADPALTHDRFTLP
jgi:SanA protein